MCGRFARVTDCESFAELFGAIQRVAFDPSYNIAPTHQVVVACVGADGERELIALRWGLVPSWSKGPDNRYTMINARAESVADKPAYRNAFRRRRCLVAADGFYEWQNQSGKAKQPFFISLGQPYAMAGIWEHWQDNDGQSIQSCAIITTAADPQIATIHERMPVIVAPQAYQDWLDPKLTDADSITALLALAPTQRLIHAHPVSTRVNKVANNDSDCLQVLPSDPTKEES